MVFFMANNLIDIKGHWCENAVDALVSMGVIHGDENNKFNPDKQCTKAETATMIRNAIMYITGK